MPSLFVRAIESNAFSLTECQRSVTVIPKSQLCHSVRTELQCRTILATSPTNATHHTPCRFSLVIAPTAHINCNTSNSQLQQADLLQIYFARTTLDAVPLAAHISLVPLLSQESDRRTVFQNEGSIDWQQHIKGPPTYYPSAEQFRNPLVFIQSIQAEACHFGEEVHTHQHLRHMCSKPLMLDQTLLAHMLTAAQWASCECRDTSIYPRLSSIPLQSPLRLESRRFFP